MNASPNPTATSNSPVCVGKTITFTGLGGTTYTWTGPGGFSSNVQNPSITTASVANAGNYTLSVTNANGCTNSVVINVVINPLPVITVNNPTTCVGSTFTLTATGGTAYAWTGPSAFNSALQNPPFSNATTAMSGNYTVVVTSAQGCTNNAVANASVITLPTVSIVGTNTLCSQNFNSSINTTSLTASGGNTYTWTLPTGFSGSPNLNTSPITITPSVTSVQTVANVTVVGTVGNCTNSAVYSLTIVPNPTIAVTSGSLCAGKSLTLTSSGASTYTWSPSASLNTPNGNSVIANPAVTTVYSVIGSSVGCNSQTQTGTATVVPNPTVSIAPGAPLICLGSSINLTASGATTYTWLPNTAVTATNVANVTVNPTTTTTFTLIGSQATCTNFAVGTVSVITLPVITTALSSPTMCMNNFNGSPNSVSITASGATSYTWGPIVGVTTNTLNGATIIATSNGASAIGSGTVIGTVGTCTNVTSFTVAAIPNPVISVTSGSMCAGTSVSLTASGANTYNWSPSASLNTSVGNVVIASPSVTTVYSVIGGSVGCNSQTQTGIATVVANPTVNITPLTPTICIGSSINLTANGATNYTWMPNTAITATTGANVTVNPTITTTYSIIGEAATCTNTAVRTVTVVNLPVISIALNTSNICMNNYNGSNNQVNITASVATSYNWVGFSGLSPNTLSGANINATALPPSFVGTGTVVETANTCSNVASFSMVIIPNPVISASSASMCAGTSATLTANGALTYTWAPANNLNTSFGAQVVASPAQTSVYSVIGSSLNCNSQTQTATVTVVANPVMVISPVTPTICAGTPIGLTAFGANNYTWSPAVAINTVNGAFVIVNPTVTTNYVLIGEAATCTSSIVRQVIVTPLPDLQAVSNKTAICLGDKLNINANGATNYTWTPSTGLSSNNSNFVVASPQVSTIYTITGNNNVCTKTITFAVNVLTRPILNISTSKQKICIGDSTAIFASGCQSYSWHPSGYSIPTNTTMAIVTPTASMNFTITGYNGQDSSACPFTKEILIEVVPQITATAVWTMGVCEGESVKLHAEASNTYRWLPWDGLNNPNIAQPYASPKSTTIYSVHVSDNGFCGATTTVMVRVYPQPTVNAGADMNVNSDEVITLNAKGTGTLTWVFGDNILCHVCPNSQITPTRSGVYQVQATNQYGCKATDDVWVELTDDYPIFIPNSFTPNYDGLNDVFLVYGQGIIKFEMMIFNKWQHQIFSSNDKLTGWDGMYRGEIVKNDSYIYVINYTTYDGRKHTRTGFVAVIREDY